MAASSSGLLSRIKFPWWRHNDMKASFNPVRDVYLHQWCGLCDKCRSSWCEFTIYPVIIFIIRYLLSIVSLSAHITLHFTSGIKRYPSNQEDQYQYLKLIYICFKKLNLVKICYNQWWNDFDYFLLFYNSNSLHLGGNIVLYYNYLITLQININTKYESPNMNYSIITLLKWSHRLIISQSQWHLGKRLKSSIWKCVLFFINIVATLHCLNWSSPS